MAKYKSSKKKKKALILHHQQQIQQQQQQQAKKSNKLKKSKSSSSSSSSNNTKKVKKKKAKNNTKDNFINDSQIHVPFNANPPILTSIDQSKQQKISNLLSHGLTTQEARRLVNKKRDVGKTTKQLLKKHFVNKLSLKNRFRGNISYGDDGNGGASGAGAGAGRFGGMKRKQHKKRLPPIEHFLPTFENNIVVDTKKGKKRKLFQGTYDLDYQSTPWYNTANHSSKGVSAASINIISSCGDDYDNAEEVSIIKVKDQQKPKAIVHTQHNQSSSSSSSSNNHILPQQYMSLLSSSSNTIQQFQNEVLSFYNYVKLTNDEINARNYIIECISNESFMLFSNKCVRMNCSCTRAQLESRKKKASDKRAGDGVDGNNGDEFYVQVFGSFATNQVSTFWSDIDLALWGVIDENDDCDDGDRGGIGNTNYLKQIVGWDDNDDRDNNHFTHRASKDDVEEKEEEEDSSSDTGGGRGGDHVIRMTTSSVQRTMELLNQNMNTNVNNDAIFMINTKTKMIRTTSGSGSIASSQKVPQMTKEDRIKRWKSALSSFDDESNDDNNNEVKKTDRKGHGDQKYTSQPAQTQSFPFQTSESKDNPQEGNEQDKKDNVKSEETEFFAGFVIDREGVSIDIDDNESTNEEKKESDEMIKVKDGNNEKDTEIGKIAEIIEIDGNNNNSDDDDNYDGNDSIDTHLKDQNDANEEDSVDIMDAYYNRINAVKNHNITLQQGQEDQNVKVRSNNEIIDLCQSDSSISENDDDYYYEDDFDQELDKGFRDFVEKYESNDGLEINVQRSKGIDHGAVARNSTSSVTIGPQGNARKMVIKALRLLSGKIHSSSYATSVETRTHARVPIICATTRLGFDCDIAVGGHNGTDTSHYVRKQVQQYESFPTVTLLLKVLLQQTNLDKPYSGGLGSYKLYVMIAYHYQKHLELGGGDTAAEIFLTFLYRYSDIKLPNMNPRTQTDISSPTIIICDGGEADLNTGVKLERCTRLFGECFTRVLHQLNQHQSGIDASMIAALIDGNKLKASRRKCIEMAIQWKKMKDPKGCGLISSPQLRDKANTPGHKRLGITFSKSGPNLESPTEKKASSDESHKSSRGPRGGLIPKWRPDIEAKPTGFTALVLRGKKHRKNNKKQKRDAALREFATRETCK